MLRVGLIGLESTRPRRIVAALNALNPSVYDAMVTAIVAGSAAQTAELLNLDGRGAISAVVHDPREMIGRVDAVIDCTRDGTRHLGNVESLIRQGTHLFVDKPLATSSSDARALVGAAAQSSVVLESYSGYRRASQLPSVRARLGAVRRVVISGPADAESADGGLFHYGIHHAEIAFELFGDVIELVAVKRTTSGVTAECAAGGISVCLEFVRPRAESTLPFSVVLGDESESSRVILTLDADYNEQMLAQFLRASRGGVSLRDPASAVPPVALMEHIVARL